MRRTLKKGTQEAHDRVESLPFIKTLADPTANLPAQLLRDHISHKIHYLSTLERLLLKQEDAFLSRSRHLFDILQCLKALFRTAALNKTASFLDDRWGTQALSSLPPAVVAYARYLEGLADSTPIFLIFHGWVSLCDGIFGGAVVAGAVSQRFGEEAAQFARYPDLLPPIRRLEGKEEYAKFPESLRQVLPWYHQHFQVRTISFSRSEVHPPSTTHTLFQTPLEAYPWQPEDIERAIAEAIVAFDAVYQMGLAITDSATSRNERLLKARM